MRQRARKLFGTVILVCFVALYALTVMTIAAAKLPGTSGLTQLAFYFIAGLAWVFPAGALIYWMGKADRPAS
jgi:hypothetical protein